METITYSSSLFTFYLKGKVAIEGEFLKYKIPNTVLGIIPLSSHHSATPINHVASAESDFNLNIKKFLISIFLVIINVGAIQYSENFSTIVFYIVFAVLFSINAIDSFHSFLLVSTTAGDLICFQMLFFERSKAETGAKMIAEAIQQRMDATNVAAQTDRDIADRHETIDRSTDRIIDALNKRS